MGALVPEHFCVVGKTEQFSWPLWGAILRRYGAIPVQRDALKPAIASLNQAQSAMEGNKSLVISPEGTRSPTGQLQDFKKGAFHIAKNTGAAIIPLGFRGSHKAKSRDSWQINPGIVDAYIGTPITQETFDSMSVDDLATYAHQQVQRLIGQTPTPE